MYNKNGVYYTYTYNADANEIVFSNISKKTIEPNLGESISCEDIEFECEVLRNPLTNTNLYLTNIVYIAEEYNQEDNITITNQENLDIDSVPTIYPESEREFLGDKYEGYKGREENPSVYTDTNNSVYFMGQEDDDDFEIIVIKKSEFDFSLKQFITDVTTDGITRSVREEPKVNAKDVLEGKEKNAEYVQNKVPVNVKNGDYVTYKFRIYNEAEKDGYINKVTNSIPDGMEFVYPKDNDGKTLIVCGINRNAF